MELLQEYCNGGSLRGVLEEGLFGGETMRDRWRGISVALSGLAAGMSYLHTKRICHGDLNPSNVLMKVPLPPLLACASMRARHRIGAAVSVCRAAAVGRASPRERPWGRGGSSCVLCHGRGLDSPEACSGALSPERLQASHIHTRAPSATPRQSHSTGPRVPPSSCASLASFTLLPR